VVVTGAAGLVGSVTSAALAAEGFEVLALSRDGNGGAALVRRRAVDLERDDLADLVSPERPVAIVHCAARVPTNPAYSDDDASAAATRVMDQQVAAAAAATGARVVYLSSCGVYDPRDPDTKSEDAPVAARSPYFEAKLDGEQLLGRLAGTLVVRLSGPVGRGMRDGLVLPRFVRAATRSEQITLWGTGAREQDFVAVEDVAAALLAALRHDEVAGTVNVASGTPVSMRTLAELVIDVVGSGEVALAGRPDPAEHDTARYSVQRAAASLGWTPRVELRTTIARMAGVRSVKERD
jgi:nucleoside-diphosphate-sugar epimerase